MVILKCCDWIRRSRSPFSLLLLIILYSHFHLQYVKAEALVTLARDPCLQRCFIPTCPDVEASCVCNSMLDWKSAAKANLCAQGSCDESNGGNAFANLAQECSILLASPGLLPQESSASTITSTVISSLVSLTETPTATPEPIMTSQTAAYPTELGSISTVLPTLVTATGPSTTEGQDSKATKFTAEPQVTKPSSSQSRSLIVVYILAPVTIVLTLVTLLVVLRRRKNARRSISSFAGVKGWNSSQMAIAGPLDRRGDEEQANRRLPPRVTGQMKGQGAFPPPPSFPRPARRPSVLKRGLAEKALPQLPSVQRPITTISEVSEVSLLRTATFQTMDSELQRAFLDVRRGFLRSSAPSSRRTSMDWSMMIDLSQSSSRTKSDPGA